MRKKINNPNPLSGAINLKVPDKGFRVLSWFTLVELIVVITILAILWTIGFMSFQSYNVFARDSVRVGNLKTIESALWIMYVQSWNYAVPDNAVEVSSWAIVVTIQWEIWKWVQRSLSLSKWIWKDPLTEQLITYWTTKNYSKYELMTFLEWDTAYNSVIDLSYAWNINKIKMLWSPVWLLMDESWTPIEKISSIQTAKKLDLSIDTTNYIAHFDNEVSKTLSWTTLFNGLLTINQRAAKKCKEWWILVPWNTNFMTNDFCVAKYEMTYSDADTPSWWTDFNTVSYDSTKTPVSMAGKYPIADINQTQAIAQCNSIWAHLITNNEWMTIARNIEEQESNYISWWPWNWILKTGVNNSGNGCGKTWWNTEPRTYATKTWSPCDWWKNKLKLNNWEYIYDMSWNVWEHVNKANTLDWSDFNKEGLYKTAFSTWNGWKNWTTWWLINWFSNEMFWPKEETWWATQWLGRVYNYDTASNVFLRGADATNGSNAGVFTLDLTQTSTTMNRRVGFRCVTF